MILTRSTSRRLPSSKFHRFLDRDTQAGAWPRGRLSSSLLLVIAGLGLRLVLLIQADWRYDYDEGMVGLQVRHILQGERPIFHPGQPYLAALESYLIAPWFAVFGSNAVTLKIVPWLLSGVYIGTTGWLGWRVFDRQVGVLSALLAAFAPSYLLVVGMKTWGATAETLVLGNLALIAASYASALTPGPLPTHLVRGTLRPAQQNKNFLSFLQISAPQPLCGNRLYFHSQTALILLG